MENKQLKWGHHYMCLCPDGKIKKITVIKTSFVFDTLMGMDDFYYFYSLDTLQVIEEYNPLL